MNYALLYTYILRNGLQNDRMGKMEGYPSGRRGLIANELVWGNLERGFKSLTLRQIHAIFAHLGDFSVSLVQEDALRPKKLPI